MKRDLLLLNCKIIPSYVKRILMHRADMTDMIKIERRKKVSGALNQSTVI